MVRNISNSIVDWINGGFQGKPGFVTDFKSLVADSADQTIGNYIYGTDLKFLCQPFSFRIRLQLATKYQKRFQEEIRCTLKSVTGNVDDFVNNNSGVGWDNWFQLTTEPQNNRYGAYLMAESELASRIQDQLNEITSTLDRSKGFLDHKVCDEKAPDLETGAQASLRVSDALAAQGRGELVPATELDTTPRCKTGGRVVTPGSLVQAQAEDVLGTWADQLNLATEIDQIVGALISQFADQMIKGGKGFLGLSSPSGYAKKNLEFNQARAASNDFSNPENAGLSELTQAADVDLSGLFESDIVAPTFTIETPDSDDPDSNPNALQDGEKSGQNGFYSFTDYNEPIIVDLGSERFVREVRIFGIDAAFNNNPDYKYNESAYKFTTYDNDRTNPRIATSDTGAHSSAGEGSRGDFVPSTVTADDNSIWFSQKVTVSDTVRYIEITPEPSGVSADYSARKSGAAALSEIEVELGPDQAEAANPANEKTVDIQVTSDSEALGGEKFSYGARIVSNYADSGLTLKLSLSTAGTSAGPIAFTGAFTEPTAQYGRTGQISTLYIGPEHRNMVIWNNLSLSENSSFRLDFSAKPISRAGRPPVTYVITATLEKNGVVIKAKNTEFTVR
jgi:hypothetical protein